MTNYNRPETNQIPTNNATDELQICFGEELAQAVDRLFARAAKIGLSEEVAYNTTMQIAMFFVASMAETDRDSFLEFCGEVFDDAHDDDESKPTENLQ